MRKANHPCPKTSQASYRTTCEHCWTLPRTATTTATITSNNSICKSTTLTQVINKDLTPVCPKFSSSPGSRPALSLLHRLFRLSNRSRCSRWSITRGTLTSTPCNHRWQWINILLRIIIRSGIPRKLEHQWVRWYITRFSSGIGAWAVLVQSFTDQRFLRKLRRLSKK